jgi:uncharacterized protein YggE
VRWPTALAGLMTLGLLLFLHTPVNAALAGNDPPPVRAIVVEGEGTVPVGHQAVLYITVESRAADGGAAQADAARAEEKVRTALRALGIGDEAMHSGMVKVVPMRDASGTVFQATRVLRVTVAKAAETGPVLDAAVRAGATATSSMGWQPLPPTGPEMQRAVAQAMANARAKAEVVARSLGVRLGAPVQVSVLSGGYRSGVSGDPEWAVTVEVRYAY